MPIVYGNANYRRKYEAFRIVDECGQEPLRKAIECAMRMQETEARLKEAYEHAQEPETKAQISLAMARSLPDQFHAWVKVAEFVYAKPKQALEVSGQITLEKLLAGSWDETQAIEAPNT